MILCVNVACSCLLLFRIICCKDLYFEKQRHALCAVHALNNALGSGVFRKEDFEVAVEDVLTEYQCAAAAAGVGVESDELRQDHVLPGGWHSEEVVASVLRRDRRWQFVQICFQKARTAYSQSPKKM